MNRIVHDVVTLLEALAERDEMISVLKEALRGSEQAKDDLKSKLVHAQQHASDRAYCPECGKVRVWYCPDCNDSWQV